MLGVALLLWPVLHDLMLSRPEALVLSLVFAGLIAYTIRTARAQDKAAFAGPLPAAHPGAPSNLNRDLLYILLGLAGLVVGAQMAVHGAVIVGMRLGLSDAVIGSTIMAVGTSLPELVTCVMAARKGHHDISVGNLVGSNIFNTLLVTGTAGLIHPFAVSARFAGGVDYWIMIAVGVGFGLAALLGRRAISRFNGAILLVAYIGYLAFLLSTRAS